MRLVATAALLALSLTAGAQIVGSGGSESVGSLPGKLVEEAPCSSASKVKPGSSATNNAGVTVSNDSTSTGDASLSPGDGQGKSDCASNVVTKSGFKGDVDGLDSDDSVSVGAHNDASVSGTGGTVALGGHSTTTVTNTGTPPGAPIHVITPDGISHDVPPGNSQTFNT